jgi:putative sigma-54 modulation protein
MNIKIHSVHFDADKKLLDFIEARVEKMNQFFEGIIAAEVFLRLENAQDLDNKIVEIKLEIPGNDLFAKRQTSSFESATDQTVDALKRQLAKVKEKMRGI